MTERPTFASDRAVLWADQLLLENSFTSFQEGILLDFHVGRAAERAHDRCKKVGWGTDVVQPPTEGAGTAGRTQKGEGDIVVDGPRMTAGPEKMCIGFVEVLLRVRNVILGVD